MSLSLNVKTDMIAPFASYGLSNRWDVGLVVPIVRVQLNPTITSTIDRISTASDPLIHSWNGLGQTTKIENLSGTATGIGDIVLRTKYRFIDATQGGVAADVDVRLPTGDKENLLGTGAVQTKLLLIASGEIARFAPHVNFGYTFSHGGLSSSLTTLPTSNLPANAPTQTQINNETGISLVDPHLPDEINYVAGVDIAAHSLVTISADMVGRTLRDSQRFAMQSQTYQYRTANGAPLLSTTRDTFASTQAGKSEPGVGSRRGENQHPGHIAAADWKCALSADRRRIATESNAGHRTGLFVPLMMKRSCYLTLAMTHDLPDRRIMKVVACAW